jgi:hypothetical protein
MTDKINLSQRTTRQLRARRRRLVRGLPELEGLIEGSVVDQRRRCGKEGCKCNRGELHGPYTYLVLPRSGGRTRTVYVPASLAEAVGAGVALSSRLETVVEEISAINVELLARRELD